MPDEKQLEHFREAVEQKNEEAAERASQPTDAAKSSAGERAESNEQQLIGTDEVQDTYSARDKNTGHGKKTADKWNQ